MAKHHSTYKYETSLIYRLYEWRQAKFANFVEFKLKLGIVVFIASGLVLTIAAVLSDNILASSYVFVLATIIPVVISFWLSRKMMFFLLNVKVENNRVYPLYLPQWVLWAGSGFINLMVVGSLSLLLFDIMCLSFAGDKIEEERIYVEKIEVNDKTKIRTAHIVFEDGLSTLISNIDLKVGGKDWEEGSNQTIEVKESMFGIRILAW